MPRVAAVVLVPIALAVSACKGSSDHALSKREVVHELGVAGLAPRRVTMTLELVGGEQRPSSIMDAVATSGPAAPASTSFSVDHSRAIVTVFETVDAAAPYDAVPRPQVVRVRNVVAASTSAAPLPRRVRAAIQRLR